jgi:hypothetical protein
MGFYKILVSGFSFYSADGASGRQIHGTLPLILCIGFHGLASCLAWLHKMSAIFSIFVLGLCTLYHNFMISGVYVFVVY